MFQAGSVIPEAHLNSCPLPQLTNNVLKLPKSGERFVYQVEANIGHLKIVVQKDLQNTFFSKQM